MRCTNPDILFSLLCSRMFSNVLEWNENISEQYNTNYWLIFFKLYINLIFGEKFFTSKKLFVNYFSITKFIFTRLYFEIYPRLIISRVYRLWFFLLESNGTKNIKYWLIFKFNQWEDQIYADLCVSSRSGIVFVFYPFMRETFILREAIDSSTLSVKRIVSRQLSRLFSSINRRCVLVTRHDPRNIWDVVAYRQAVYPTRPTRSKEVLPIDQR